MIGDRGNKSFIFVGRMAECTPWGELRNAKMSTTMAPPQGHRSVGRAVPTERLEPSTKSVLMTAHTPGYNIPPPRIPV